MTPHQTPVEFATAGGRRLDVPITDDEIALVRAAAAHYAKDFVEPDDVLLDDLAARWRAIVPSDHGERLVETYVRMYPFLEDDGGIDSWGGSESKTILTSLVLLFPTDDERWVAVREALEVANRLMALKVAVRVTRDDILAEVRRLYPHADADAADAGKLPQPRLAGL